jgi:hypothetical protein
MTNAIAWVDCDHAGCDNGLVIDARHCRNLEGRSWLCPEHERAEAS